MIAWLVAKAISSGYAGKVLASLLVKVGIKSTIANAFVPIALRSLVEIKDAIEKAEEDGTPDEELVEAVEATLPPASPEAKLTAEKILRGEPFNV